MADKKKQHTVPKCYLKLFSNEKGGVSILNLKNDTVLRKVPYANQCQSNYYYGKEPQWENLLSKLESDCAPIFCRIVASNDYYPTPDEINSLRRFAIFQRARSTVFHENTFNQRVQSEMVALKMHLDHKGIPYNDAMLQSIIKEKLAEDDSLIQSSLEIANDIEGEIDDLGFVIINFPGGLVTSDNPVILINPFIPSNIGFATMGLLVFFPIGPTRLAFFYDAKLYPDFLGKERIVCTNPLDIQILNAYQFMLAHNILIGNTYEPFSDLIDSTNAYKDERNKILNRNPTAVYKNSSGKLVITLPHTVFLNKDLSFCRLLSDAGKIPMPCREAIPRARDDEYLLKIRDKYEMFPSMYIQLKEPLSNAKLKELRQGTQQMERLANHYWK